MWKGSFRSWSMPITRRLQCINGYTASRCGKENLTKPHRRRSGDTSAKGDVHLRSLSNNWYVIAIYIAFLPGSWCPMPITAASAFSPSVISISTAVPSMGSIRCSWPTTKPTSWAGAGGRRLFGKQSDTEGGYEREISSSTLMKEGITIAQLKYGKVDAGDSE